MNKNKDFFALFRYRDLLKQLVIKDLKLKYRRSFLGYIWSVLNPLMVMVVMFLVFSQMFRFDIENYPAYLIIGQSLFSFMTDATNQSMGSIYGNAALIKKIYVPKYIFTVGKVSTSLMNLLFSLAAMAIVFVVSKVRFSLLMLFIPVIILEIFIFCMGVGLFLGTICVFFRDVQYIYSVFVTAWMYLTPIFYPLEQLPETLRFLVAHFNPMCIYITQFRMVCLYGYLPAASNVAYGFGVAFAFLLLGAWYFNLRQNKFILYI